MNYEESNDIVAHDATFVKQAGKQTQQIDISVNNDMPCQYMFRRQKRLTPSSLPKPTVCPPWSMLFKHHPRRRYEFERVSGGIIDTVLLQPDLLTISLLFVFRSVNWLQWSSASRSPTGGSSWTWMFALLSRPNFLKLS